MTVGRIFHAQTRIAQVNVIIIYSWHRTFCKHSYDSSEVDDGSCRKCQVQKILSNSYVYTNVRQQCVQTNRHINHKHPRRNESMNSKDEPHTTSKMV